MAHEHLMHPQVDSTRLAERLRVLFSLGDVTAFAPVYGGYMCHNYRVETPEGRFFLKQYRNKISTVVHEIKYAEEFFVEQGLPVILPVRDKFGRTAFWLDGHWLSLFPFIEARTPKFSDIDERLIGEMGGLLARFHEVGARFDEPHFQPIRLWDKRQFCMELVELEQELERRQPLSALDQRMRDLLTKKTQLVAENRINRNEILLPNDRLLHGDFIYSNLFVNEANEITHVYDVEKACMGPRAYEVARSLFINAFDDGWEEKNYRLGRTFLAAYTQRLPMSFEEFRLGVKLYLTTLIHMNWIEARYLVYGIDTQLAIYERHARRVEWAAAGADGFCEQVFPKEKPPRAV